MGDKHDMRYITRISHETVKSRKNHQDNGWCHELLSIIATFTRCKSIIFKVCTIQRFFFHMDLFPRRFVWSENHFLSLFLFSVTYQQYNFRWGKIQIGWKRVLTVNLTQTKLGSHAWPGWSECNCNLSFWEVCLMAEHVGIISFLPSHKRRCDFWNANSNFGLL